MVTDVFKLSEDFLSNYKNKQPKFGPVGYITYKRTYARPLENGKTEEYWQTVQRVVEGVFTIQKEHCDKLNLEWNPWKAQKSAQRMFQLMWDFKFTPPGRGLWMMGAPSLKIKGGAVLNNCAFISTENIDSDFAEPFCWQMDMSMLGVGVGFDTKGAKKIIIKQPKETSAVHVVADTREGWVEVLRVTLKAFEKGLEMPTFDYSQVRPSGTPLKGMGGVAGGPGPLMEMQENITKLLNKNIGKEISSEVIVDLMNFSGKCVVSGGIRRTAQISFGDYNDKDFLELKDPTKNQTELYDRRWASNNSIFANIGMNYSHVAELTKKNGEPGYMWLENAQKYSRMNGIVDNKDYRARGGNPCLEQTLEPWELCCLVETYPSNHETLEEWHETLKYAYLYAKTVTLVPTHHAKTNNVMNRNRRIGCSISGITEAFTKFGRRQFLQACEKGYDEIQKWDLMYSEWLGIPRSIKTTSIKPSGSVSLLAGTSPGIHYPYAQYYFRTIRFQDTSNLLPLLRDAGYKIEKDKYSNQTYVVYFPVKQAYFDRAASEVSMWEQLENAAQIQEAWADNQVSVTITFKPEEANQIKYALELYETRLKGVSFLPFEEHKYEQAPYTPITKEEYEEATKNIKKVKFVDDTHEVTEKFCDSDVCII